MITPENTATIREIRRLLTDASRLVGQLAQVEGGTAAQELSNLEDELDTMRHKLYEMQAPGH